MTDALTTVAHFHSFIGGIKHSTPADLDRITSVIDKMLILVQDPGHRTFLRAIKLFLAYERNLK